MLQLKNISRVYQSDAVETKALDGVSINILSYVLLANAIISVFKLADGLTVQFTPIHALILIAISVLLTVFAGSIPARRASKKDPVEALRSE